MELFRLQAVLFLAVVMFGGTPAGVVRRKSDGTAEYLSPPLDVQAESVNCTAISVRWRMPWRHVSTTTGYKVTCTEIKSSSSGRKEVVVDIPITLEMRNRVQNNGHAEFATVIGNLDVATEYSVTVGAYGWAGQGRPSMPRGVRTSGKDPCMRPAPPPEPSVMAVSDTEIALSWQPDLSDDSPPVLYFHISYIRPELDTEWTSIRVPAKTHSMVLRGMSPDTQYQFLMQAVNMYGESQPSPVTGSIWTLSVQETGSGQQHSTDHTLNDYDLDVYHIDTFHEQLMLDLPVNQESQPSLGNSESQASLSGVSYGMNTSKFGSTTTPTGSTSAFSSSSEPVNHWRGPVRQLYDLPCEDTACPPNSVCIDDFTNGGSRCHCALGRGGETCSDTIAVRFPKFSGYSYIAFEPLKNSYYSFEIKLEFRADGEDGLLLYCGENDQGEGDFASLALIRGKLYFRYNCGTGAGQIMAQSRVKLGVWHTVTVFREGLSSWLRVDSNTPLTGRSAGEFTKITFRTPLYLGGSPSIYWLAKAAGTNRGFQGCVQSLSVNGRMIDMRPWPMGRALSGADVGECSDGVCIDVNCENGGVCYANRADYYVCLCPLGYRGPLCQESFSIFLPHFNETLASYLSAPWPQPAQHYLSFMELELIFLPAANDGTLLYSEDSDSRDFLSVTLVGGYVEFRFDCGSGATAIKSEEPISLFRWHEMRVSRTARRGILQLDSQKPVEGMTEGAFTQIRCSSPLYFGGVPNYDLTKDSALVQVPFTGSIQKVIVNDHVIPLTAGSVKGVNVESAVHPCADSPCANGGECQPKHDDYDCDCALGYKGKRCQSAVSGAVEVPQFTGRSYLMYYSKDILKRVSGSRTHIQMYFRSTAQEGLLIWIGDTTMRPNSDYMFLALHGGAVVFSYNLGSGTNTLTVNGTFTDDRWHRVKAVRDGQLGKLSVDNSTTKVGKSPGRMRQLNTGGALYVGGIKEASQHRQYLRGLVGCISHLTLSTDYHIGLMEDASDGKNINTCLQ
ncbi:pikachurin-like isoform X1 [Pygocentrus nattereri]|uniref:pikachurin-like isoform X1 n=2 Tax=Pygocentrus nattereri TaxID=42514 RepID=UPI0008147C9F|nr:pikachurin-like isoform X1 [Pygocentrus nattereri]